MAAEHSTPGAGSQFQQALDLHRAGRADDAAAICRQIVSREAGNVEALHLLGTIEAQRGAFDEAAKHFGAAVKLKPDAAALWQNHANALAALDRSAEAVESYGKAVALAPDMIVAHYGLVGQLVALGRAKEALAAADRSLAAVPGHHVLETARGNALMALGRSGDALTAYDRAIATSPRNIDALAGRGLALLEQARPAEALATLDQALALVPGHLDSIVRRAHALVMLARAGEALAIMDRVTAVVPRHPVANYVRGHALLALMRMEEAAKSFEKAAEVSPDMTEAIHNQADALRNLGRHTEAMPIYERVLAIEPDHTHAMNGLAASALYCCDWRTVERLKPLIEAKVRARTRGVTPFTFLTLSPLPELQLACSESFVRDTCPAPASPFPPAPARNGDKLRVAYLSSDYRRHAMAYQMAELFEVHDRSRFEVIGFSGGPDDGSPIRKRIIKAFDGFHEVAGKPAQDIARLIREQRIDITVDLNGNTANTLLGALAWRPAGVQATYLGFPGTTGAKFVDYVIADDTVAPFDDQPFFSERIVHLPGCYQVSDSLRASSPLVPSRRALGLPEQGVVFACFNTSYKISGEMFASWMRILAAVPGAVLWLVKGSDVMVANLRREAHARGIASERLVFCGTVEPAEHLARHSAADLFLDTLPYNSHGTGSFALWGGLPMLTCKGPTFPGRVAASLLKAVGLPELVTHSMEEYEAAAIALANDALRLAGIRAKLAENRLKAPLFDTDLFRRHIEAAYVTMHETAMRGEAPRSFAVEPQG